MTLTEKDVLNCEFAELVEIPWHEEISVTIFCGEDRFRCSCGAFYDKRHELLDHVEKSNPDYAADPRWVLREMVKRREWNNKMFSREIGIWDCGLIGDEDWKHYTKTDLILDTTGKLRNKAIEFLKEERS